MFRRYYIIGLRSLKYQQFFTRINISGPAIYPTTLSFVDLKNLFLIFIKEFIVLNIVVNIIARQIVTLINEIDLAANSLALSASDFIVTGCAMIFPLVTVFPPAGKASVRNPIFKLSVD